MSDLRGVGCACSPFWIYPLSLSNNIALFVSHIVVTTEYMDYRFLKDLELKRTNKCLCCCTSNELEIYCDDHDASGAHKDDGKPPPSAFHPHVLRHPEAPRVEEVIRHAWNRARLVAE